MGQWYGMMRAGTFDIQVVVTFALHLGGDITWRGAGTLDKPIEELPAKFPVETNIGRISVKNISYWSTGSRIEFSGIGSPKGPLAEGIAKILGK